MVVEIELTDDYRKTLAIFTNAFEAEERGDLGAAIVLYKRAARRGFTPAMTNLGILYDDMLDPSRPDLAISWYKRAVGLGDCAGASNLAAHYKNRGSKRWHLYWLRRAADMGDADAVRDLRKLKRKTTT